MPSATSFSLFVCLLIFVCAIFVPVVMSSDAAGQAYLAENAKRDGVVTTASGLQYRVLQDGPIGGKRPTVSSPCSCHYRGTLINGQEFDSSYSRGKPATFAPNQVIKGWTEAMQLMHEGDKWELTIPSELAYGDRSVGQHIKAGNVLVFELELLEVKGPSAGVKEEL
mmetsp:Transcript_21188/g.53480  ORF Transcript_21188/g.53480 Transcript_21188/m.53480 type:complete len:167 (+) Transcript_21188:41-541(+)|eukprot:CAMPEP_0177655012 /NCGR_PEP_ID=MMETSP0447-20121125/14695_1 /TAXON_ID=0 /ORGANISM="Stygamoeba regulata, Strain BSH-02190019" /LENGTH=166 /DNA_ID=CAMNT_0019158813 /DNA_START=31 /DNA_END=531 /DNA_ORIENTATION=+